MEGWIKLHRSLKAHWLWTSEPFSKAQAWIDLIMHANFTDNQILIKGQVINLKRGQQARSELTLSKDWKWSRNKVRRFLETLKKQGMIVTESGHLTTIITICKYESFQTNDTTDETPNDTSGDTTSGQQAIHSKEGKERKNGNKTPTTDEIDEYFLTKGINDKTKSERFFNYYSTRGWLINNSPIYDWKALVNIWISTEKTSQPDQPSDFVGRHTDRAWADNL
jgi:hypothetical protein